MCIRDRGACGIFHIVGSGENTLSGLIALFQHTFPITGVRAVPVSRSGPPSPLESLVDGYLEPYYPYFCDKRTFDDANTARYLGRAGKTCAPLDAAAFKRCMDFAVSVEFGAKQVI